MTVKIVMFHFIKCFPSLLEWVRNIILNSRRDVLGSVYQEKYEIQSYIVTKY